jgi:Leucine-rich repeat (LRR) protein
VSTNVRFIKQFAVFFEFRLRCIPSLAPLIISSKSKLRGSISGLEHLTALVHLDLSENSGIDSLDPVDWSCMRSLEELNLDKLGLRRLPSGLSRAPRLSVLSVQNNLLKADGESFPQAFLRDSPCLHTLHLEGNDHITEQSFMELPGVDAYLARRKAKVDKQLAGGTFAPDLAVI